MTASPSENTTASGTAISEKDAVFFTAVIKALFSIRALKLSRKTKSFAIGLFTTE